ncbi:unnamed protein product [Urochloa humidicola]
MGPVSTPASSSLQPVGSRKQPATVAVFTNCSVKHAHNLLDGMAARYNRKRQQIWMHLVKVNMDTFELFVEVKRWIGHSY